MKYNISSMDTKTFNHVPMSEELPNLIHENTENGRQYILPNGERCYSVTTVTGFKKNEFFKEWRKNNAEESQRVLRRGNNLHKTIERYLNNENEFLDDVSPNEYILFEQILPELNSINNIVAQEISLWSDVLRLAGRVDCVAEYNNKLSIIDFKGSTREKRKHNIENYFLQATAYSIMWQERTGIPISNIVILISCEDGTTQVFEDNPIKYVKKLKETIEEYEAAFV